MLTCVIINIILADHCEAHVYQDPTSCACDSTQEVWVRLGGWKSAQV